MLGIATGARRSKIEAVTTFAEARPAPVLYYKRVNTGINTRTEIMKLIDRSLLREMVVPFLIGQAAIVLMLIGSVLYNNATILLMNRVPLEYVAKLILYFLPFLIHMTMPVAMAVGASLAVSRLGR